MIGFALDLPVGERLEGTLATTVLGVLAGCAFVRVHDVRENKRAIQMTKAILEGGRHSGEMAGDTKKNVPLSCGENREET